MYSTSLPFTAVVVDLTNTFIYFKYDFWLLGGATAIIALFPVFVAAFLLYSRWRSLKQVIIFLGFLHSGAQLLFQITILIRFWSQFNTVLITYGTLSSPQYILILISIVFSSLVVAKSARECHFLCQTDPAKNLHVRASHFRATPFFLLHSSFRSVSLGLVVAFLPVWAWALIMSVLLVTNFVVSRRMLGLSPLYSTLTSFTSLLTPSIYPTDSPVDISLISRFHIINSLCITAVIVITASTTNSSTLPHLLWTSNSTQCTLTVPTPSSCPPPPPLTSLLQFGVLPPVLVTGFAYVLLVVLVMGLIRPSFLSLPSPSPTVSNSSTLPKDRRARQLRRSLTDSDIKYKASPGFEKLSIIKETDIV